MIRTTHLPSAAVFGICTALESSAAQMLHCLIYIEKHAGQRLVDTDSWPPGKIISTESLLIGNKPLQLILNTCTYMRGVLTSDRRYVY